ncbi:MAG TPA: M23 family metallopeptidase [Candidatus Paceibacterota bacterium]|jgi:murein DD-endopeptidase MepM/ murein hydrolase activator NlpD|nr:M23 family metallopeptidase [Candidatus Paceibacterota bacterium]HJN62733.1 M23 family metallopeptidase [Candidatus Paceibacterota bacterium]|tara:strand:+ start:623 stop:1654 length:1032 start_codon:yes stop_codon:yes gene_type:complete
MKYWLKLAKFTTKFTLVLVVILLPTSANAGFFSFVGGFFERFESDNEISYQGNSQNMALLQAALNHDPAPVKGGGDITIVGGTSLLPETGPSGSLANIEDTPSSDRISVYVVRKGDSLSQIANMFGVSTNTIVWANEITNGKSIQPGQTLIILPISGVTHIVAKGETVKAITNKYKGDYNEVLAYNGLTLDSVVQVGDKVVVPEGEFPISAVSTTARRATLRGVGGPSYDGYYMRPISGGQKSQGLHGYNGVDLDTYGGAPIFAAANGKVIISKSSGWNGGYGKYVVISHGNGTQTLYAHNSQNIVYPGQNVVKGQVIGYIGSTGRSTGSHLHFEVRGAQNPF